MSKWIPCSETVHSWYYVPQTDGKQLKCRNCGAAGFVAEVSTPMGTRILTKPRMYTCYVCKGPTKDMGMICPNCLEARRAGEVMYTEAQLKVLRTLQAASDYIPMSKSEGSIISLLYKQKLVKKKTITVWQLSKKGLDLLQKLAQKSKE